MQVTKLTSIPSDNLEGNNQHQRTDCTQIGFAQAYTRQGSSSEKEMVKKTRTSRYNIKDAIVY